MQRSRCRLSIEDTLSARQCNLSSGYLKAKFNLNDHFGHFQQVTRVGADKSLATATALNSERQWRQQIAAKGYQIYYFGNDFLSLIAHTQVSVGGIASACELYTAGFTCYSISAH